MKVRAARFADVVERDGEALVLLRGGGLVRLSPLGAAIVELAVNPIELEVLAGALERRFGRPPEGTSLVVAERMVHELAGQGLLQLGDPPPPDGPGPFWRISDDAAFVVSDPERVVLLNLAVQAGQPIALLGTAAAAWRALVGPDEDHVRPCLAQAELLQVLAEAYGTRPADIEADVDALLERLGGEGYLVTAAGSTPEAEQSEPLP